MQTTYFKAFNSDLRCRNFQFELGKTYREENVILCERGFHCCENILNCLEYYPHTSRFCEVMIGGETITDNNKTVAEEITIFRELFRDELNVSLTGDVIFSNGDRKWYRKGELHREGDLPAIMYTNGSKEWWVYGKKHRDCYLPAYISLSGRQEWWIDGNLMNTICPFGIYTWWKDGVIHRDGDSPAVIHPDHRYEWWKEGKMHRDGDLPAILYSCGSQEWYKYGKRHRDGDLPAISLIYGTKYSWGYKLFVLNPEKSGTYTVKDEINN